MTDPIAYRALVEAISGSIRKAPEGQPFVLSSGRTTDFYIDLRGVLLSSPEAMHTAAVALYNILPDEVQAIGGVPTAGLLLSGALLAHCFEKDWGADTRTGFYTRETPKAHGMNKQVEGAAHGIAAMVEDTVTTGGSIIRHAEIARQAGIDVRYALAIFDREEGGRDALAAKGITLRSVFTASRFSV